MNKKFLLLLLFITYSCEKSSEYKYYNVLENLKNNNIYLVFRDGNGKQSLYAKKFNIIDTIYSHVGVLYKQNNNWKVAHITSDKNFTIEKINEFYFSSKTLEKGSIWQVLKLSSTTKRSIYERIHIIKNKDIKFDNSINLYNDKFYCSELVVEILGDKVMRNMKITSIKIPLRPLYKAYFNTDSLEYYPVDIFQSSSLLKNIGEW